MTPREQEFVTGLAAERAGLEVDPRRGYLIESALAPVARREGYLSVSELIRSARDRGDQRLAWAIVEAVAPARTAFFRDPEVFDAILEHLPASRGEPLRIWSAACGSGQEVYSLAMLMKERGVGAPAALFGSDLNERLLEKAQAGLYSGFEVQQGLSAQRLVRHFEASSEGYSIDPALRRQVRWRRVNLLEELSRLGRHDVVLCRYLLSAMLRPARLRVLASLVAALSAGGMLVVAPGEAIEAEAFGLEPVGRVTGLFRLRSSIAAAA